MNVLQILWDIDPELVKIGPFSLRYYSVLFAVAFILGFRLMTSMYRREGLDEQNLHPLLVYIIVGTIIGARLGQTLFYEFDYYKSHPLEIILPFRIGANGFEWTGYQGLASHGGAIGIVVALAFFCRRYKTTFLPLLDKLVIAIALAGFFVRLGNLFNSEILGKPTTLPWAFIFSRVDALPRHPSQLYEAIAYLFIFIMLGRFYKNKGQQLQKGFLFGLFLVLVFSARFLIEFTKENQEAFEKALPLNMGQLLSIPFILTGLYFLFRRKTSDFTASSKTIHNGTFKSPPPARQKS